MPKHFYSKLTVRCRNERFYGPGQLREAVEYLRTVPAATEAWEHFGLMAEANVQAGEWKLRSMAFLSLDQIVGRTPREVWEMFDEQVDGDIEGLLRRQRGFVKIK